jgi:hypothetical protein
MFSIIALNRTFKVSALNEEGRYAAQTIRPLYMQLFADNGIFEMFDIAANQTNHLLALDYWRLQPSRRFGVHAIPLHPLV